MAKIVWSKLWHCIKYLIDALREIFCENGVLSSKRVLGAIIIIKVTYEWGNDVHVSGFTEHNTMIAEMLVGCACVLLGISAVFNKKPLQNGAE